MVPFDYVIHHTSLAKWVSRYGFHFYIVEREMRSVFVRVAILRIG